jgi:hypothetical protein
MNKNVYARTAEAAYAPAYISVNRVDDSFAVTVRDASGGVAAINLTRDQAAELGASLNAAVLEKQPCAT